MPDRVVSKSFPFLKMRKGESNLAVDLDNEMTSIIVAENGSTKSAVALHPLVRAFYGTQSVIGDCTVTASSSDANVTATYNTTTHCVDVSIQQNVQLSDVTTITITVTHSTYGTRVVYFIIAAVRDGIDAFIQELLPSLNEISFARQSDNSLSPSSRSLTLSFKKTKGETVTIQSISESGLTVRWSASSMPATSSEGNSWGSGTGVSGITWSSNTMQIANSVSVSNIYIACFNSSGTLVDRETIPVIKDGVHGTSPYFQDLNNEMDAVQCKHDGSVISAQTVSTTISMWKGSATEQFVIDNIYRNGTQLTWDTFNSGVKPRNNGSTVYLDFNTNATISNVDDFKITIHSYNDNSVTRELHFNVKGVRANAIYRLVPSHSQIVKKKNNTYEPSGNITCSVEKTENGATSTPSSSEYTLEKSVNGGSYESYSATAASSITSDLKFRLTVDGTVVDLESIPLVSDGDKGNDGVSYSIVFTKAAAKVNENNIVTAELAGFAYKYVGGTRSVLQNTSIRFGYILNDSDTYADTTTNSSGFFDAGTWFNGDNITDYGKNSPSIFAAIVIDGNVVHAEMITISVKGNTGNRGKVGRFFYYAGIFDSSDSTTQFIVNDAQSPFFQYNNQYWVYNPDNNPSGGQATMSQMGTPSSSSSSWEIMTNDFKYIITEAIFGRYAHFGSFIINDDWLISQHGTINGQASTNYTQFDPDHPNDNTGTNFIPNFAVDGLTGKTYQNDAYIRGEVHATSGTIGGFEISSTTIKSSNNNIILNSDGSATLKNGNYEVSVDTNKYVKITSSGFEAKWGTEGFKIDNSGIQRWDSVRNVWSAMYEKKIPHINKTATTVNLGNLPGVNYVLNARQDSNNHTLVILPPVDNVPDGTSIIVRGLTLDCDATVRVANTNDESKDTILIGDYSVSETGVLAADCAEFIMCKGINKTVYVHLTQITTRTVTIGNAWICNMYDREV